MTNPDPSSPSQDNPIGNVFDKFFGKPKAKNLSQYLDRLGSVRESGEKTTGLSFLFAKQDKYNILNRLSEVDPSTLGKSITGKYGIGRTASRLIRPGDAPFDSVFDRPSDLGDLFSNIKSKYGVSFMSDSARSELYMTTSSGLQIPMPIQHASGLDSGIVSIGGSKRGAYRFIKLGHDGEYTYSQLYYRELQRLANSSLDRTTFLRKVKDLPQLEIGTGVKGKIRLSGLLTTPSKVRGDIRGEFTAKSTAMKMRVGLGDNPISIQAAKRFKAFREAKEVINTLTKVKSGGLYVPRGNNSPIKTASFIDPGMTTMDMFIAAQKELASFYDWLPSLYKEAGVAGMHAMSKADFLTGEKGLVLPSSLAKSVYGSSFSTREQEKGLFQFYKQSRFTVEQMNLMSAFGVNAVPSFVTQGELGVTSTKDLLRRRTGKIAILNYHPLYEEVFSGDSGGYLTPLGETTFADRKNFASINIKGLSKNKLKALEVLGLSPRGSSETILQAHEVGAGALSIARDSGPFAKTNRARALRTLLGSSGRHSGAFDLIAKLDQDIALSANVTGSTIRLNFNSAHILGADTVEALVGLTRMTLKRPSASSPLAALSRELGEQGVEVFFGRGQLDRFGPNFELSNFLETMKSHNMEQEALRVLGVKGSKDIDFKGLDKTHSIPIIDSYESALASVAKYKKSLIKSRTKAKIRLARALEVGTKVTTAAGVSNIVKSVTTAFADLSIRSDVRMDMNMISSYRLTPVKVKNLALSSMMMGYGNPNEDPVFRTLTKAYQGGFGFSNRGFDFRLDPSSNFYQYFKSIGHADYTPTSGIITRGSSGLMIDGEALTSLPSLSEFRMKSGGIKSKRLKGTILDPKYKDRLLFLDLGEGNKINLLGKRLPHSQRYIPIPTFMSRAGTIDSRIVIGKNHPFVGYLGALERFQGYGADKNFTELIQSAAGTSLSSIIGKTGLLAKMNTIHVPESIPLRIAPNTGGRLTSPEQMFNIDNVFEARISRAALSTELLQKKGFNSKAIEAIQKIVNEKDFTYVMLGADPTQRPEHIGNVYKLLFTDDPYQGGGLDIELSSVAERMFERDRDRDAIRGILIEGMMGPGEETTKFLEERIARQKGQLSPIMSFMKQEMLSESGRKKGKKVLSAADIFAAYTGQKSWASYGYTIERPVERVLPLIAAEGEAGLARYGINVGGKLSQDHLKFIQGLLNTPEKMGAAFALNQYLFQSGVDKATKKGGLVELGRFLVSLAEDTKTSSTVDLQSVITKSEPVFADFLRAQKKQRVFQAAEQLFNTFNFDSGSLEKLQAGLVEGAALNKEQIISRVSAVMARTLGVSAALAPLVGTGKNVSAIIEDSYLPDNETGMAKLINAALGTNMHSATINTEDGLADDVLEGVFEAASKGPARDSVKSELLKNLKGLAKSKYLIPALGVAAVAGTYGYMNRPSLSSNDMPYPSDVSMPTDTGPILPDYSNVAAINTSRAIPHASRNRQPITMNSVRSNYFNSRSDSRIIIEDKIKPTSPWLLKQQMDRVSESDFVY